MNKKQRWYIGNQPDIYWDIIIADSFLKRFRGLLGTRSLKDGQGILLNPCNSVHMVGMLYPIDIIYLDVNNRIIKLVENLQPFWGISCCWAAKSVLEVPAGTIKKYCWHMGDYLCK